MSVSLKDVELHAADAPPVFLSQQDDDEGKIDSKTITVTVKFVTDTGMVKRRLKVQNTDTAWTLKNNFISEGLGATMQVNLIFKGSQLHDQDILCKRGVKNKSVIFAAATAKQPLDSPDAVPSRRLSAQPAKKNTDLELVELDTRGRSDMGEVNEQEDRVITRRHLTSPCARAVCPCQRVSGCQGAVNVFMELDQGVQHAIYMLFLHILVLIVAIITLDAVTTDATVGYTRCFVESTSLNLTYCGDSAHLADICYSNSTCWDNEVEVSFRTDDAYITQMIHPTFRCPSYFEEHGFVEGNTFDCAYTVADNQFLPVHAATNGFITGLEPTVVVFLIIQLFGIVLYSITMLKLLPFSECVAGLVSLFGGVFVMISCIVILAIYTGEPLVAYLLEFFSLYHTCCSNDDTASTQAADYASLVVAEEAQGGNIGPASAAAGQLVGVAPVLLVCLATLYHTYKLQPQQQQQHNH
jgi:hypothetical protein